MKNMFLSLLVIGALPSISMANTRSFSYKCNTDTNKAIVLEYSYANGYSLDRLTIDGENFRSGSTLSVSRDGTTSVLVQNFRNGQTLYLTVGRINNYRLGDSGSVRSMTCENTTPKAPKNDGI